MTFMLLALVLAKGGDAPIDVLAKVRNAVSVPNYGQSWPETILVGSATFNGVESRYALQFRQDGAFNQSIKGALGETQGFDGKTYWEIDRSGASRVLAFEDVDRSQALLCLFTDRWLGAGAKENVVELRRKKRDEPYRFEIHPSGTEFAEIVSVDPNTWLPTEAEFTLGSSKTIVELSNWGQAGAVRLPFKVDITNEGVTDSLRVTGAAQAPQTSAAVYAVPSVALTDFSYDSTKPATIESKRAQSGHVFVHPLVNGKDIGWFILDSGADSMVIDKEAADSADLPKIGKEAVMGVGGAVQEPFRTADSFVLGPATLQGPKFVEIDLSQLSGIFKIKVAGIVGYDFFRRFIVKLNLKKPSVEVDPEGGVQLASSLWTKMLFSSGNPVVKAKFEGNRAGWFRLDTGANGSVTFHSPTVREYHLLSGRKTSSANMAGVGGMSDAVVGKLAWFELGGHRFKNVDATFSLAKTGAFADEYLAGNIGQDLMEPFTVVFDFAASRVAFLPE